MKKWMNICKFLFLPPIDHWSIVKIFGRAIMNEKYEDIGEEY